MTTPFDKGVLERFTASACQTDGATLDALQNLGEMMVQIHAAPFVYTNTGLNNIVAYEEYGAVPDGQLVAGGKMWAIAQGGIHKAPAEGNGFVGIVRGKPCQDRKGNNPSVKHYTFFIRGKEGQNYSLKDGDVFGYSFDTNGERIVDSGDCLGKTGEDDWSGGDPNYLHNDSLVAQQPNLNFVDTTTLVWTVTDDGANDEVEVEAQAKQTYQADGVEVGTTSILNLKAGSNVTLSGAEAGGVASITINSTASGGLISVEHNGSEVVETDTLNFADTTFAEWTVTDDDDTAKIEVKSFWKYGKAQHNWEKGGEDGLGPYVLVKELTSYGGSEMGDEFKVYFRGGTHHQDPNVVKDDIVMYFCDVDGRYFTFGGWDLAIGSVIDWSLAWSGGGLPKGWAIQNGSENATDSGGSGIDWHTDAGDEITTAEAPPIYFAPTDSPLAPGNSLRPVGDNTLSHFHTVLVDPASTGIDVTVDAHPDHVHPVGCATTSKKIANDDVEDYYGIVALNDLHQPSGLFYTGKQQADSTTHGSGPHSAITLDHNVSVNDPGHGHTGTALPTYQPVHYKSLIKIERIDNNRTQAGN